MSKLIVVILSIIGTLGVRRWFKREMALVVFKRYNKVNLELNVPPATSTQALMNLLKDIQDNKVEHVKKLQDAGWPDPRKIVNYLEWEYRTQVNILLEKQKAV